MATTTTTNIAMYAAHLCAGRRSSKLQHGPVLSGVLYNKYSCQIHTQNRLNFAKIITAKSIRTRSKKKFVYIIGWGFRVLKCFAISLDKIINYDNAIDLNLFFLSVRVYRVVSLHNGEI